MKTIIAVVATILSVALFPLMKRDCRFFAAGKGKAAEAATEAFVSDEQAVDIAKHSFAETPVVDDPPPVIRRENGKTVVFLPRWRRPEAPERKFPEDWLPVWIDNETLTVVPSPDSVVSESEALEIAKAAIGSLKYDKNKKITTERNSICFVFTFPAPPIGEPGTYLGPDFAAKVGVNSETREVLFVRVEQ